VTRIGKSRKRDICKCRIPPVDTILASGSCMIWVFLGAIAFVSVVAAGPIFVMVLGCRGVCRQIDKEADRVARGHSSSTLSDPTKHGVRFGGFLVDSGD
jgi:hypothetical protein